MVDLDTQIAHAERKATNADGMMTSIASDISKHEAKLDALRSDLAKVRKAADQAAEAQRQASTHNVSLSPESLDEYRRLKAAAALEAVSERQQLETLAREEKTEGRAMAANEAKLADFENAQTRLEAEKNKETERAKDLEEKIATMQEDLKTAQAELDRITSERTRVAYACVALVSCWVLMLS